ncbi:MAG: PLAT/LH2 domain-containing protein [Actinomycetes bacterium]
MSARKAMVAAAVSVPLLLAPVGTALAAPATASHAGTAAVSTRSVVTYEVSTYTSNIPGAGTDGDVWVRINGSYGSSGWLYLDNSDNNFERNQTDRFYFTLSDLGYLNSVDVYFNRAGFSADWHLANVSVGGAVFPANRWFTSSGTQVRLYRA